MEENSKKTYFYRSSPGKEVLLGEDSVDIELDPNGESVYMRKGSKDKCSMIIGLGRNDFDTAVEKNKLIENINSIINMYGEGEVRYLIWEIPPWTSEPVGSDERDSLDSWNKSLEDAFGERYITPIRKFWEDSEQTFYQAKTEITDQDKIDIENKVIPASLRRDSRGHLNEAGKRAWAYYTFQEMKKRGW